MTEAVRVRDVVIGAAPVRVGAGHAGQRVARLLARGHRVGVAEAVVLLLVLGVVLRGLARARHRGGAAHCGNSGGGGNSSCGGGGVGGNNSSSRSSVGEGLGGGGQDPLGRGVGVGAAVVGGVVGVSTSLAVGHGSQGDQDLVRRVTESLWILLWVSTHQNLHRDVQGLETRRC